MKAYVSLFKVEALRVLEDVELARSPVTEDALERLEADTTQQTIALLTDADHK